MTKRGTLSMLSRYTVNCTYVFPTFSFHCNVSHHGLIYPEDIFSLSNLFLKNKPGNKALFCKAVSIFHLATIHLISVWASSKKIDSNTLLSLL